MVAGRLARHLGLPVLTAHRAASPKSAARESGWVAVAGVGALLESILCAADTAVWLHYSPLTVARLWIRNLRLRRREAAAVDPMPGLADVRDSVVHAAWTPHLHRLLRERAAEPMQVFHLRNPNETDFWLHAQEHRLAPDTVTAKAA
jgi:hypothetical protein